uniref:Uncharacterized protein n=1 Tax=Meloidogyne enterolobii TaxID=390850 RepID=A0A6V7UQ92_MELEN|nr:unnamed protein product [Meloidogyne enterolobii]
MNSSFNGNIKLNDSSQNIRYRPESSPPEELMDCLLPDASTSTSQNVDTRGPKVYPIDQDVPKTFFQTPKPVVRPTLPDQICVNSEMSKFHKPSLPVIKKQLEQLRNKLSEIPNVEWRRHIDHLITLTIQQQSDIDLLRTCSLGYEQWASGQLKKFGSLLCEHANLTFQKKKLEEHEKLVVKEKNVIESKVDILEKERKRLESEVKDLRPYKEKYKDSLKEMERLKSSNETFKKTAKLNEEKLSKTNELTKNQSVIEAERNNLKKQLEELQNKENGKIKELEEKYSLAQKRIKVLLTEFKCEDEKKDSSDESALKQKISELEEKLAKEKKLRTMEVKTNSSSENNDPHDGLSRTTKRELSLRDAEINRLKVECAEKAEEIIEVKSQIDEAKHSKMELREKLRRKKEEAQTARNELKVEQEKRESLEQRLNDMEEKLKLKSKSMREDQNIEQKKTETVFPSNKLIKSRINEITNKKNLMEKAIHLFADKQCGKCVTLQEELGVLQQKLNASVQQENHDALNNLSKSDKGGCKAKVHAEKPSAKEMPVSIPANTIEKGQTSKRKASESDLEPNKKRQKKKKSELQKDTQQHKDNQFLSTNTSDSQKVVHPTPLVSNQQSSEKQKSIQNEATTNVVQEITEPQKEAQQSFKSAKTSEQQKTKEPPKIVQKTSEPQKIIQKDPPPPPKNVQRLPEPQKIIQKDPPPPKNVQKTVDSKKDVQQTSKPIQQTTQVAKVIQQQPTTSQKSLPLKPVEQQQSPVIKQVDASSIASRIVTSFMMFIGEPCNVNNDARVLIPDFLKRYGLPPNHLIGTQLAVIAEEAQKAKEESMVK